jgi:hypothetical protein
MGSLLASLPAFADILFTGGGTGSGSFAVSASADFSIDGSGNLEIVVKNLTPPANIGDVSGVLDGLNFTLTGGTETLKYSAMSAAAAGFIDCFTGNTCATVGTFTDQQGGGTVGSPYEWGQNGSGIAAGGTGTYHPAGIVDGLPSNANNSVIGNKPHNDLLEGPVTFTIPFNSGGTAPTGVSGVQFLFGTGPVCTGGLKDCYNGTQSRDGGGTLQSTVPEPTSVILFGGAVLFTVRTIRRRRAV